MVGNTISTCNSTYKGAQRFNEVTETMEYCNGSAWTPFKPTGGTQAAGYFVITKTTYNGAFGSLANADAACLTELGTTNKNWFGYAQANAEGRIVSGKVKAFLCDASTCNNLQASTKYYYSSANDDSAGGEYFTTNSSGFGPNDTKLWSRADTFASGVLIRTNRSAGSATAWNSIPSSNNCNNLASSSSSDLSQAGGISNVNAGRWSAVARSCDISLNMVCFVNP